MAVSVISNNLKINQNFKFVNIFCFTLFYYKSFQFYLKDYIEKKKPNSCLHN